jgi:lipoprotein-releasing system permease protein
MNLAFYISKRYLLAKKSHNAINIITAISVGLVAVGTMALIIIMSVFNGLETLVGSMDQSVSSDLLIEPINNKYISKDSIPFQKIKNVKGVKSLSRVLEDNVLLKYSPALEDENPRELIALVRGVDNNYNQTTQIESKIIDGTFLLNHNSRQYAVLGNGVASRLQIHLNDFDNPIHFYFPKANADPILNPLEAVNIENALPYGVFSAQQELDDKLVICSLDFVQSLMGLKNKYTSIVVAINKDISSNLVQSKIYELLGDGYSVKNRQQQNEVMYNIMKSEKWSSFMILSFILFIATFNLVGALSVLIIDKQEDIFNLSFMGASNSLISKIFLYEGFLVTLSGTLLGLVLGSILVFLQDAFHFVPMQGSFIVDSFPVELRIMDLVAVLSVVIVVSMIAVFIPIKRLSNTFLKRN